MAAPASVRARATIEVQHLLHGRAGEDRGSHLAEALEPRPRRSDSSYSRAFATAMPAWAARTTSDSSSSVNSTRPAFSVR